MKTSSCLVALLLLASPLLATVDTFASTKTFTAGTATVKYGNMADPLDSSKSRLYFEITGPANLATSPPAAFCLIVGVAGPDSSATDWKGADIGTYSMIYTAGSDTFTTAVGDPIDLTCYGTTTAGITHYCTTRGLANAGAKEAGQNWAFPGALVNDWVSYTTGTLKFEILRSNLANDGGVDLAYVRETSKILFAYAPGACATTGVDVTFLGVDTGMVDPLN